MNLATTTAAELVERDPVQLALYGLDDPQIVVRVTVSGDGEKPRALLVGKRAENGQHYAMLEGGGIVFTISKGFAMSLKRELRDTMVLLFSRAQASRVEFSAGDAAFAVARDAGEWKVESPEGGSVRTAAIEDELIGLSRLRTERFVRYETAALEEYGLLKPRAVVRIETPSGIAALSIGDVAPSGHYYGASTTVEGVFLINPGDVINVMDPARLFTLAAERPAVEGEAPAEEPAVKGEAPAEAPSSGG